MVANLCLLAAEQNKALAAPISKAIGTAVFLKEQGKVDELQASYSPFVNNQFVR
jgi:taurine transport system substrate-binding protein